MGSDAERQLTVWRTYHRTVWYRPLASYFGLTLVPSTLESAAAAQRIAVYPERACRKETSFRASSSHRTSFTHPRL